jgi:hypothetical protein
MWKIIVLSPPFYIWYVLYLNKYRNWINMHKYQMMLLPEVTSLSVPTFDSENIKSAVDFLIYFLS